MERAAATDLLQNEYLDDESKIRISPREPAEAAEKATRNMRSFKPFTMKMPMAGKLAFPTKELADGHKPKSDVTKRLGDYSFECSFDGARDVLKF